MKKISFVIFLLAFNVVFCSTAVAIYSPAYGELTSAKKQEFDNLMKNGDAAYQKNDYRAAREAFEAAAILCPKDYYASANLGRAEVAEGMKNGDMYLIQRGYENLGKVQGMMSNEGISDKSFEYNDMMAKVRLEQAKAATAAGDKELADTLENAANYFRIQADEAKRAEQGLPLSPIVTLAGTGLVALLYRHRHM